MTTTTWEETFSRVFPSFFDQDFGTGIYGAPEEILDFIRNVEARAREETITNVDSKISKLLSEFANTPIRERANGWHWLLKVRAPLRSNQTDI